MCRVGECGWPDGQMLGVGRLGCLSRRCKLIGTCWQTHRVFVLYSPDLPIGVGFTVQVKEEYSTGSRKRKKVIRKKEPIGNSYTYMCITEKEAFNMS